MEPRVGLASDLSILHLDVDRVRPREVAQRVLADLPLELVVSAREQANQIVARQDPDDPAAPNDGDPIDFVGDHSLGRERDPEPRARS